MHTSDHKSMSAISHNAQWALCPGPTTWRLLHWTPPPPSPPPLGLSLLCSKNYLLFLPKLPKSFTYYSYFVPISLPIILFLFYCVIS